MRPLTRMRHVIPVVVVFALVASACRERATDGFADVGGGTGRWEVVPEAPLSARHGVHAFSTGDLVFVLGGTENRPVSSDRKLPPS